MPTKLRLEAIAPIQNKVGHFVSTHLLRNIVGQARSTLDLRTIMDEGRILLVNLSKGRIGDDASALLGSFLVTALQLAAMGRAPIPEADRRDCYLYVDEFQNYATDSFATILSEARKYRLNLTIANQYLAQIDEATLAAVFGNIGTLITFQVGAQDAEIVAQQLGGSIQPQDLLTLPRYAAYCPSAHRRHAQPSLLHADFATAGPALGPSSAIRHSPLLPPALRPAARDCRAGNRRRFRLTNSCADIA